MKFSDISRCPKCNHPMLPEVRFFGMLPAKWQKCTNCGHKLPRKKG